METWLPMVDDDYYVGEDGVMVKNDWREFWLRTKRIIQIRMSTGTTSSPM